MILNTLSLGDIDIYLLDVDPFSDPILAIPGSAAIVLTSGEFWINQNGVWQVFQNKAESRNGNLPHYMSFTSETPIPYYSGTESIGFKIDIIGDGEIIATSNSGTKTISKSGVIFPATSLSLSGRSPANGKANSLVYVRSSASIAAAPWSESNIRELWMSADGVHVYLLGTSRDRVLHGTLSTPFDISTLSKSTDELLVSSYDTDPSAIFLSPDRTNLYICGTSSDTIRHFSMSTPGNLTTATLLSSFSISGVESTPNSVVLSNDGTSIYFIGATNDRIFQYPLITPWLLSSIGTQIAQLVVSTQENAPTGISFNETGTKVYVIGTQRDTIFEYTLGAPWSIATGAFSGRSLLISGRETDPHGVFAIGEHLYICGHSSDLIHQYSFTRETPNFEATVQEIIF